MESQNYKNHRKFYAPHHFVFLPLLFVLEGIGIYKAFNDEQNQLSWILFSVVIFLIFYLAIMLRQHYALVLQNRIVRLEFRQRYFEIFGLRSDDAEEKLSFGQIAALRFTYDDEFKILLEKSIKENMKGDEIKRSITKWRADQNRV
ncbi:DUF6526 family protein [Chryseobacterium salviniae]|uniref:DUF6526 family protein n=1 Tax=Chryseobacterium salviniae TaxID=3101750 RepID=A0ABU6HXZ2_9FLAO|nr:DUF6526 family protein [Chryseobacterium sp. T9W2-O]MEC3876985.1 DUF6526 family protein [Chryseobacterium sp. T9W2-O]